jgi:hypothetical protein
MAALRASAKTLMWMKDFTPATKRAMKLNQIKINGLAYTAAIDAGESLIRPHGK